MQVIAALIHVTRVYYVRLGAGVLRSHRVVLLRLHVFLLCLLVLFQFAFVLLEQGFLLKESSLHFQHA